MKCFAIGLITVCFNSSKYTVSAIGSIGSIGLFTFAHTPYCLATYFCFLAPLIWMWRRLSAQIASTQLFIESFVIGFAMCWLITGFVEPAVPPWGVILHGAGCLLFSLQILGIALVTRASRGLPILRAAPLIALTAIGLELLQAWLGLVWSTTNPSLAIATTPIAQWSGMMTPFGLSAVLYLCSCLLVPDNQGTWPNRLIGPVLGCSALATLWIGGMLIESRVVFQPLQFSAMLVQPNVLFSKEQAWEPWNILDPLTTESLASSGPVDLIVWPETCLTDSWRDADTSARNDEIASQPRHRLNLQDFVEQLLPRYQTNCLVGVNMREKDTVEKYGLMVPTVSQQLGLPIAAAW